MTQQSTTEPNPSEKKEHFIITGASRGFGRDLALELAGEQSVLHLISRSDMSELSDALSSAGSQVHTYRVDLADESGVSELVDKVAVHIHPSETSKVILINNAGVIEPVGPAGKYDGERYRKHLIINYVAPVMLSHAFLKQWQHEPVEKGIIMVSSGAANNPYFGWSHYCSSKAGVDMFVQVVGLEQQSMRHPAGIVSFNPGRIGTDMQHVLRETSSQDFPMVHDFVDAYEQGLLGRSRDVAARLVKKVRSEGLAVGELWHHSSV